MAFRNPITIRTAVDQIHRNEYVLPAIQREFIWSPKQIVKLFDSLMRGYPIGSLLFWAVDSRRRKEYKFYNVLHLYHQRDQRHSTLANLAGNGRVTAILDGQQRLTSLYLGLRGSYTYKTKHKHWNDSKAFLTRRLYLNLLAPHPEDEELQFDFRFLTDEESKSQDTEYHWFLIGNVLDFRRKREVSSYLKKHKLDGEYAQGCLDQLYLAICKIPQINYYLEEDQDIEKVLNIFVRLNSGGTQLDYSDLLLSMATAQWNQLDAREEVHRLVDDLNRIGFSFKKAFVLKSCLVLSDAREIGFRASSFKKANTTRIESLWPEISAALRLAANLASSFGYDSNTLTSNNVLIPVAYYLLTLGNPRGFVQRREYSRDRKLIRTWIARALIGSSFGASSDRALRNAWKALQGVKDADRPKFPIKALNSRLGLRFQEEDIDDFMDKEYGNRITFSVLALLYPSIDYANLFHIDHVFPRAAFSVRALRKEGLSEDDIGDSKARERIANLQLLEGRQNQEKSSKMPYDWLRTPAERRRWRDKNFAPNVPQNIRGFRKFYNCRRERMKKALAKELDVKL